MTTGRVYLDTNTIIAAFEGERDAVLPRQLVDLFATGDRERPPRFCTSELTLGELLVRPYRDRNEVALLRYESLLLTSAWLEVTPVSRSVLAGAALLRAVHRMKLPDAIHVSTALHLGCTRFLTADTGVKEQYALSYAETGRQWSSGVVAIVRPAPDVLAELMAT